ncbi:hypothetical protein F2Q68_00043583 [Brassica cretica]|uniref:Uncharacterized protein n=1 Tax=Brassica cretica TaxID=69181 RepID=A0A8S9LJE8_BRACR|nr:hypothetical protein F2Q68_00043583 [Brassica cretica]
MDALIKMLKDNGNIHGYSFGASMAAKAIEMSSCVADIARIDLNETSVFNPHHFNNTQEPDLNSDSTQKLSRTQEHTRTLQSFNLEPSKNPQRTQGREGDGKALVTYSGAPNICGNDHDFIRRSEMDALIKMLKENGNTHGYSFGAFMIAKTIETSPCVADIARMNRIKNNENARNGYTFARTIKMNQDPNVGGRNQQESSPAPFETNQTPHHDHEGGSEPETQENGQDGAGLSEEGEESVSGSHNQGDQSQGCRNSG